MRYWWVNQNQTHRQEVGGGYLWSPKRNANGGRNPFYESMREVAPGDVILSFVDTRIIAIGIAQSYCFESPKPVEFGSTGQNWENVGWKVLVAFTPLANRIRLRKNQVSLLPPRGSFRRLAPGLIELDEPFAGAVQMIPVRNSHSLFPRQHNL